MNFRCPDRPKYGGSVGAQVLSTLDALSGFTQIELAEEDREKTAFRTHRGLFQFRRMPFGLRNGPSIFQRIMQNILAPYLWLFSLVYIDDIVVYSKTYEDHIEHLDKVLEAIENAGLTLSPQKCHLFYDSVLLLGHKVSRLGLSVSTSFRPLTTQSADQPCLHIMDSSDCSSYILHLTSSDGDSIKPAQALLVIIHLVR